MWSSLSAYLYNDDANQDVAASSPSPSAAAAAVPRPPPKTNTPVSLRTPSPRSSPITVALSGGSKQGSAGKLNRASFDRSDNVAILRGVIVGMKRTGKTILIRRLRGEDPFQQRSKSGQQRSSVEKRKLMALVPWNIPTDTEKINNVAIEQDERVQLYVSESAGFVKTQEERSFRKEWSTALHAQRGKDWNFAVWMIDPDMKNMLQYLQSGLDILFPAADAAAESEKTKKQQHVQHLCILLNFRDTQQDDKLSTLSQARKIVESVRKNAKVGTAQESTKPPIILVYESSMRNSYGLEELHSFITLPYLAQKEDKLMRQVKLAQLQQQKLSKSLMESKVTDYNEFVASGNQENIEEKPETSKQTVDRRNLADTSKQTVERQNLADTSKQTAERSKLEEEREMLKKQLKQQQQELDKRYRMHRKKSSVIMENQIISNEPEIAQNANHSRKLFQSPPTKPETKKAVVPKKEVGEISLESFFAEDESDDEVEAPRHIDKRRKSPIASSRAQVLDSDESSSDSDDSDDDFFIDISGTRSTLVVTKRTPIKIEPIVSVDSKQHTMEEKGDDAKDESASKEINGHDAEKEKSSDCIHGDAVAASEEESEKVQEATRPNDDSVRDDGNSIVRDDKEGNDALNSNEEDKSEKGSLPPKPIDSDVCPKDENSVADDVTEEKDAASASNAEGKDEDMANDGTSNIDEDETVKMSGEDVVTEPEVPAKETSVKDDVSRTKVDETAEANDHDSPTAATIEVDDTSEANEDDDAATTEADQTAEANEDDDVTTTEADQTAEANEDDDAATTEVGETVKANDDDAGTELSGTGSDSPVIENEDATEEEQVVSTPPTPNKDDSEYVAPLGQQTLDNDDVVEAATDEGCGDEPEEEITTTGFLDEDDLPEEESTAAVAEPEEENTCARTIDEDDVPEEENTAAATHHQNQQASNGGYDSEEDKTAPTPPQQQAPDDDGGKESDDEFIVPASQGARYGDDDGESEDEFIVPATKEQPLSDESLKLNGDAVRNVTGDTDRNGGIKFNGVQQKSVPIESTKHDADVSKAKTNGKTNGMSTLPNNNISTVSSAALAAIEQARLEAEQIMAQAQPTKPKKEKKKKKDKVKKEKKAKKSKKKEESS